MSKLKENNRKLIWKPYLAIYLYLFICLLTLNGCAQRYSADSKSVKKSEQEDWYGSTCPIAQMTYDKLKAGEQQLEVCQPEAWSAAKNVVRIKHLYISSQLGSETLDIARENGVELVLNLRDTSEFIWDEKIAA